jgi:probable addiction module antidote protein
MATSDIRSDMQVSAFDEAEFLKSDEDAIAYVQACLEEVPPNGRLVAHALGAVARARNAMSRIAQTTGLSRESLYKALSGKRDPGLTTILKVMSALDLPLQVGKPVQASQTEAAVKRTAGQTQALTQHLNVLFEEPSKFAAFVPAFDMVFDATDIPEVVVQDWPSIRVDNVAADWFHFSSMRVGSTGRTTSMPVQSGFVGQVNSLLGASVVPEEVVIFKV